MRRPIRRVVYAVGCLLTVGLLAHCAGNTPPAVTQPSGVMTATMTADRAVRAADVALSAIEALTPNPIPRQTTIQVAQATEQIGKGAKSVAAALRAYVQSRSAEDWTTVQGRIRSIQDALDVAVQSLPEQTRIQVQGILQPVIAELLRLVLNAPEPVMSGTPHAAVGWIDCNGRIENGRCVILSDRSQKWLSIAAWEGTEGLPVGQINAAK